MSVSIQASTAPSVRESTAKRPGADPPPRPRAVAIDRDVDALAERERRGIAPGLLEEAAQELGLVEERRRRDGARADEAVAELHGAPQRARVVAAEPERRVRLLQGGPPPPPALGGGEIPPPKEARPRPPAPP